MPDLYPDDASLMTALAAGEERALAAAMNLYLGDVLALATRVLGDPVESEDVAQESFIRMWQNAHRWDSARGKAKTWLLTIALNLSRDRLRKKKPVLMETLPDQADPQPDALSHAAGREEWRLLRAGLDLLPERQKSALVLFTINHCSHKEIAAMLGVQLRTVESLVARARRNLRANMEKLRKQHQTDNRAATKSATESVSDFASNSPSNSPLQPKLVTCLP